MARPAALMCCVLAAVALAGCQSFYAAAGIATGVNVVTLTTLGRTVPDVFVSLLSDRDCSMVRLEQASSYCVPPDVTPPPAFCTHSLASADCWAHPALLPGQPVGLAEAPALTPAQIEHGQHRWPNL